MSYNNYNRGYAEPTMTSADYMTRTYRWMALGLLVTFAAAFVTATTPLFYVVNSLYLLFTIAELALVFVLSARVQNMSVGAARGVFLGYALLNGMVLSYYFLLFDVSTLVLAFLATALYFGLMAVYGTTTHKDLSGWGPKLMLGLIALLATGFVACSEDEGAQILGGLYEKVDITPEPGMNLVGRVTDGTGPIEGVVVSDGVTVTTTDAQGIYQMRVKRNAPFVFVSVPAEYEIPVENGMPKIYKKIAMGDNDVVQRSFKLERTGKKKRFTLLALADVQIGRDDEVTMLDEEVLPLLIPYVQQELEAPVYGISLGDLVWDNMPFHEVYKQRIRKIGVPVFQVIGNHDHNKAITVDADADASFEAAFGPTYYSYNIGDCHFIVLDDVLYTGSSSYTADITDEQMAWLEQDLKYVPKDKLIIIGLHIATSRRNRPTSHVADYKELYALLDGYNVRILSGHSHNNYTTTISETIEENTLGAVMGAYWNGEELCNDGSPRGYAVYEIEGNRIRNWYYKGTAFPREYQMYLYGPGEAVSEKYRDGLILNIFNWHTTWTVEVQEDNAGWVTLPSDSNLRYEMDRRAYDFMFGDTKPEHRPTAEPESNNDHMFYYKPASESWGTVTVRASDPYGNVYTESIRNE